MKKKKNQPVAKFAPVNRNLLHFPLARAAGAPLATRHRIRLDVPPYLIIVLHRQNKVGQGNRGMAKVWLRVPMSLITTRPDMARAPTRFDVDVLLRLTANSVMGKQRLIHEQAFAAGRKAILATGKKRQRNKLFYKHNDRYSQQPEETFKLALNQGGRSYVSALDAGSGKPNPYAEKAAGKAAYKAASKNLRQTIAGDQTLRFESMRQLLAALERATNKPGNYRSVERSLLYLSSVELVFAKWYVSGNNNRYEQRTIRFLDNVAHPVNGTVTISVNPEFLSTTGSYFAQIPLPLPLTSSETAQNFELWLHAFGQFHLDYKVRRKFADFCQLLGMQLTSSAELSRALDRALDQVNRHRAQNGRRETVKIENVPDTDTIAFKLVSRAMRQDDDDRYAP
ncbi:hypothetical protein D3227_13225 [Mesorhizobium waimense]|uniref:Uncharacterized protein n=1 Tax=Mesorhizobium waimense TaxID=1300307 RepID=A0A3A5L0S3_9HYPH|nr:hypothetical protein [Mesorhizobium waimense]RJT39762.1 hypothetical protein D3227_13225 [Mesorhizobium waimense]